MWRIYHAEKPTNIWHPSLKIERGDKLILDTELKVKCIYYVTYQRGNNDPIKFEVTDKTWTKLANNSK